MSDSALQTDAVEQLPETLWIEHELYCFYTAPLSVWLQQNRPFAFEMRTEACARGYIGRWEIRDGMLWLIDLHGWIDGKLTRVPDLFDGAEEEVADWYSGDIVFEPNADTLHEGAEARMQRVYVHEGRLMRTRPGHA